MEDIKECIRLRPHHGMCLAYFEGKGYSEEFTENMKNIFELLQRDAEIKLTIGGDEICRKCPNLQNNICISADKVEKYDKKVLENCNLQEDDHISFKEFVSIVQKNIIETGNRSLICGNCHWNYICADKKSRWEETSLL